MKYLAAFLIIFSATISTNAQAHKLNVKNTKTAQNTRIVNGVQSGALTKCETMRLVKQQKNIKKTVAISKSDGVVTRKERAIINAKQHKADKKIYRLKHN